MTGVEVLDGTSSGWGFSGWDMVANTAGAGLFIGQDIGWGEQRLRLKLSSHLTDYAAMRPELLGEAPAERVLKDSVLVRGAWFPPCPLALSSADAKPQRCPRSGTCIHDAPGMPNAPAF